MKNNRMLIMCGVLKTSHLLSTNYEPGTPIGDCEVTYLNLIAIL